MDKIKYFKDKVIEWSKELNVDVPMIKKTRNKKAKAYVTTLWAKDYLYYNENNIENSGLDEIEYSALHEITHLRLGHTTLKKQIPAMYNEIDAHITTMLILMEKNKTKWSEFGKDFLLYNVAVLSLEEDDESKELLNIYQSVYKELFEK